MKFYELSQEVQDRVVERQRNYVTSCMDWLEDLFPLINDRVNEEYGRIFTEPFDALMNIQEFEWPHNIVWSTTYTELDLAVFEEALGVNVPSYNARLEVSPNGRVWLFFGNIKRTQVGESSRTLAQKFWQKSRTLFLTLCLNTTRKSQARLILKVSCGRMAIIPTTRSNASGL